MVSIGVILFHSVISVLVLILAQIIFKGNIPLTTIYFPLILLPLLAAGLGVSWFLSALAVYFRDITQITGVLTTILMFTSAVFFPISSLPEHYQTILLLNPLVTIISESRNALIFGHTPKWAVLGLMLLVGLSMATGGYWWFQKARKGFADVL